MNRKQMSVAGAAVGLFLLAMFALPIFIVAVVTPASAGGCTPASGVLGDDQAAGDLTASQRSAVAIIVAVTRELGLPQRAAVIAVATAQQESSLQNLPYGDEAGPDSRGLFQQRLQFYQDIDPMVPDQAARAFLTRLVKVPGWDTLPLAEAAQAVQISKDGSLYAKWEPLAVAAVAAVWGSVEDAAALGVNCLAGTIGAVSTLPDGHASLLDESWWREHPDWFGRPHHDYPAMDLPVPAGTTVFSPVAGKVVALTAPTSSCGNGVILDGDDGIRYTLCHGSALIVPEGVRIDAGTAVMVSGWSGTVRPAGPDGAHLHIQMARANGTLLCPQLAVSAWVQGLSFDLAQLPEKGCVGS